VNTTLTLNDIIIDPEFQALIPPLSANERTELEANVLADGCLSPLVVWREHNILLDGHNRHEICRRHSLACAFRFLDPESREAAKTWIIKHQLGRRNLNESQRAMLAATLKEVFAVGALKRREDGRKAGGNARRENAAAGVRKGDGSMMSNLTSCRKNPYIRARDEAAEAMNVSYGLVHAAEKVQTSGSEKLRQTVMAGEASVSAAAKLVHLPAQEQDRIAAQGGKAIASAARQLRGRSAPTAARRSSIRPMKPIRESQPLPAKTALEMPHDPVWAGRTLISVFDREFLVGLVQVLTTHLNEGVSQ